jgi:FtsP/CotA-like multicopper oxidase with cupredoxin domain
MSENLRGPTRTRVSFPESGATLLAAVLFASFALALSHAALISTAAAQTDSACALSIHWDTLNPPLVHQPFQPAKVVEPTSKDKTYELSAEFVTATIAGCAINLRSYNSPPNAQRDFLIGDTIKAKPGDTLYIRLTNNLPDRGTGDDFPQHPAPPGHAGHFSFNMTNLHTHGLHVAPNGPPGKPESDNVFIEIAPGASQDYEIKIPLDHPSGTFWYHAHLHGATAVQVSSGMSGALIIEGGDATNGELKAIPEIAAAKDQIFVLQQLVFGPDGKLEDFKSGFDPQNSNWARDTTVNGQAVPTLKLRPGEVQRWRFVHAGFSERIDLALDGHKLNEVAADGTSLDRLVPWDQVELGPGYRTDVLVKAGAPGTYFLRSKPLPQHLSFRSLRSAVRLSAVRKLDEPPQDLIVQFPQRIAVSTGDLIARIVVEGDPLEMKLPTSDQLKKAVPEFKPIGDTDIKTPPEVVLFNMRGRICDPNTGRCPPPNCLAGSSPDCEQRFLAGPLGDQIFMPDAGRTFQLNTASKWLISGAGEAHVFHIHVNPFQASRVEPDGVERKIWRDTLIINSGNPPTEITTRYVDFPGSFVMHCHVLNHEDRGMMEKIIIKP